MRRWLPAVVIAVLLAGCYLFTSTHTIQCDGTMPTWMIEAQDYDGGGCAEVLPSQAAPPGADWTPYCLGYCIPEPD